MECDAVEGQKSSFHTDSLKPKQTLGHKGRRDGGGHDMGGRNDPAGEIRQVLRASPRDGDDGEEIKEERVEPTSQVSFSGTHHPSGRKALRDYYKDEARVKEAITLYIELARTEENTLKSKNLDATARRESERKHWLAIGFLYYDFDLQALDAVIQRLKCFDDSVPDKYGYPELWATSGPSSLDAQIKASKSAFAQSYSHHQ